MPATSRAPRPPPRRPAGRSRSSTRRATPTRPMPAIQNFAQRGAGAIVDMVFPFSSIGAGLDAAKNAKIPVVTWGGGLGGTVAATNGSGGPMVVPVIELMIKTMDGKGSVLALTYHTGEVCRNREVELDKALARLSRHQGDQERSAHSRLFRGRRAIRQRLAGLPSGRQGEPRHLGLLGRSRRSARSARSARRTATTSRSTASTAMPRRSRTSRRAS